LYGVSYLCTQGIKSGVVGRGQPFSSRASRASRASREGVKARSAGVGGAPSGVQQVARFPQQLGKPLPERRQNS